MSSPSQTPSPAGRRLVTNEEAFEILKALMAKLMKGGWSREKASRYCVQLGLSLVLRDLGERAGVEGLRYPSETLRGEDPPTSLSEPEKER